MLHTALVLAVFGLCLWAIVSPAVPTGVLGTVGLCLIGAGALLGLDDYTHYGIVDVLLAGVVCGGLHVAWRVALSRRWHGHMRRLSDWAPGWDDSWPPPRNVDPADRQHIAGGRK